MRARSILVLAVAALGACSASPKPPAAESARAAPVSRPSPSGASASTPAAPSPKPSEPSGPDWLTREEARAYMLALINRDRASEGLGPVTLDGGPPTHAGQAHADDMAKNGYLGHFGTDGSVPEQRLTEAGGADMVLENASCFTDAKTRALDPHAKIARADIERAEDLFFHEVPPNDGHRKNILKPQHTAVGVGVAQPVATPTEIPTPCFSQEFVDAYGEYGALPKRAKVGTKIRVEGRVHAPATVGGVGIARVDLPRPLSVADANARRSYLVPTPYVTYWPPGFVTPIPVAVKGEHFAIDVPLDDHAARGMYEISIWGKLPGVKDFAIISLRTILVQ